MRFLMLLMVPLLSSSTVTTHLPGDELSRIKIYSAAARQYCVTHHFNSNYFFFADMHLHSGKNRFFIINMQNDSIIDAGLVAHGSCGPFFSATAIFSNEPGCACSCYGRFKVAGKYAGRFGNAYKLYGLDSSNSNAYKRNIVLHSYYEMPDNEIYPGHVCNSQGCPMVSKNFLKRLSSYIDASKKPILLWIVN